MDSDDTRDAKKIFAALSPIRGDTGVLGGLLRHYVRCGYDTAGLYRSMDQNIELFAKRFGLDAGEVRGVIDGVARPSDALLEVLDLEVVLGSEERVIQVDVPYYRSIG